MRKSLVLAMVAVLACSSLALAGVPDPTRSGCSITGAPGASCQYRFKGDGSGDQFTCTVTLRDAFDTPVAACSTSANLNVTLSGTFCDCSGSASRSQTAFSDSSGIVTFILSPHVGGFGTLSATAAVTTHCNGGGNIEICSAAFGPTAFTSPDLNASCETSGSSTGVFDLGAWAGGLSTYKQETDYNCDLTTNVFDLGYWAGGLNVFCTP